MALCVSCSREIPGDSRVCPYCALPVGSAEASRTVTAGGIPSVGMRSDVETEPTAPDSIHHGRFTPGTVLADRYRIVGLLGKGGMGDVYRAEDVLLGQQVALKFLSKAFADNARLRRAFQQEVRVARHVSHPNVCRVYDVCEAAGEYFITMEYIDGEDLASLTRRIGRLPEDVALRIARQVCGGLAAAHENGILHRDLKPRNIMFDGRGKASIADFGIAGFARSFTPGTHGFGAGTLAYMAPEQLARREVTEKSDLYSLGLVLYYIFTGRPAFSAESVEELLRLRANSAITPPSNIVGDLDPRIDRLILRCVSEDPAARPASALAIARELPGGDQLAEMVAAGVTPSPDLVAGSGGGGGFTPRTSMAFMVAALAGIALVAFLADRSSLLSYVRLSKSPAVLADRAEELISELARSRNPISRSYGFAVDGAVLDHIAATDQSVDRWRGLGDERSSAMYFWYRQSPTPWAAGDSVDRAARRPAPLTGPGAASVRLDPTGRLIAFEWLPSVGERSGVDAQPSWADVFGEAGLSLVDFVEATVAQTSPVPCDTRFAWQHRGENDADELVRVEAGTMLGGLVFFRVVRPWDKPVPDAVGGDSAYDVLILTLTVVYLGMSLLLARRNLRLGIGDLKRAKRLALFFLLSEMFASLLDVGRMPNIGSLWQAFIDEVGEAMFWAGFIWLMYVALEPFARRRWPRTLISWNRLLSGRLRDAVVGSELLVGVVLGTALLALDQLTHLVPRSLGAPPPVPYSGSMDVLLGSSRLITELVFILQSCVWHAFGMLFLSFLFFVLVRRERWAKALLFLTLTAAWILAAGSGSYYVALLCVLQVGLIMHALFRFGLLALSTTLLTAYLLSRFPVTWDTQSWIFGGSLFAMTVCALLAAFGCCRCVAGRPLLRSPFLGELDGRT